jgi:DNA invertase Pin-like site-specific DNA recombinase
MFSYRTVLRIRHDSRMSVDTGVTSSVGAGLPGRSVHEAGYLVLAGPLHVVLAMSCRSLASIGQYWHDLFLSAPLSVPGAMPVGARRLTGRSPGGVGQTLANKLCLAVISIVTILAIVCAQVAGHHGGPAHPEALGVTRSSVVACRRRDGADAAGGPDPMSLGGASEELARKAHGWWIEAAKKAGINLTGFDPNAPLAERIAWAIQAGLDIAVVLSRFSSKFQHSTDAQVQYNVEYGAWHGLYTPPEFICVDEAEKGRRMRRDGLQRAKAILKGRQASVLLVFKVSRLLRTGYKSFQFVNEEVVEEGLRAISTSQGIDTLDEKTWKALMYMYGMMDDLLLDTIADHCRAGLRTLFQHGYVTGALPVGYRPVEVPGAPPTNRGRPRTIPQVVPEVATLMQCKLGDLCPCKSAVNREKSVRAVCRGLIRLIRRDADLVRQIICSAREIDAHGDQQLQSQIASLQAGIQTLTNKIEDLEELAGQGSDEDRQRRKAKTNAATCERASLQLELTRLQKALAGESRAISPEDVTRILDEFTALLEDGANGKLGPDAVYKAASIFRRLVGGRIWVHVDRRPGRKRTVVRAVFTPRLLRACSLAAQIAVAGEEPLAETVEVWLREPPKLDALTEPVHQLMDVEGLSYREAAKVLQQEGYRVNSGNVWYIYRRWYEMRGLPVPKRPYNNGRPRKSR